MFMINSIQNAAFLYENRTKNVIQNTFALCCNELNILSMVHNSPFSLAKYPFVKMINMVSNIPSLKL